MTNRPCENCDLRKVYAHMLDMHFTGEDCPYECEEYEKYKEAKEKMKELEKITQMETNSENTEQVEEPVEIVFLCHKIFTRIEGQ